MGLWFVEWDLPLPKIVAHEMPYLLKDKIKFGEIMKRLQTAQYERKARPSRASVLEGIFAVVKIAHRVFKISPWLQSKHKEIWGDLSFLEKK